MLDLEDLASDRDRFRNVVREGIPYRPIYVKIKLTWQCNLRCQMCNVWRQSREHRLTLPVVQALADELASLGTSKIHLSGGEVLLRPDLFEVISAFAVRGMQVNLTTNGTLLTPRMATGLVESGICNVSVSLDGAMPGVHDRLRGKGNWKHTIRGIRNLRRAAKHASRKVHIRINTVITRQNYRDLAQLPEIAFHAGADRLTLIPVDDPAGALRLNKRRILEYNEEIAPYLAHQALNHGMIEEVAYAYPFGREKGDWQLSKTGLYARGLYEVQPCYMPWIHAMIDPMGKVYPCCTMRGAAALGNLVKAGSFGRVWEGRAFGALRQDLGSGQCPAYCHTCDDFLEENLFLHGVVRDSELPS